MVSPDSKPFMTDHEMIREIRDDVKNLAGQIKDLGDQVVFKEELQLWKEARKTTARWAIGTIISILVLLIMFSTLIIQTR